MIPALLFSASLARAQAVPTETQNPVSAALREILPGRQKNTVVAVEAMPADKFNYKPSGDQKTFGQLVDHMADTNYLLCGKAAGLPARTVEGTKDTDSFCLEIRPTPELDGHAYGLIQECFHALRAGGPE